MKLASSLVILGVSAREKVDLRADLGDFNEVVGEALITPSVAESFEEIMGIPPNARMIKESFYFNYCLNLKIFQYQNFKIYFEKFLKIFFLNALKSQLTLGFPPLILPDQLLSVEQCERTSKNGSSKKTKKERGSCQSGRTTALSKIF